MKTYIVLNKESEIIGIQTAPTEIKDERYIEIDEEFYSPEILGGSYNKETKLIEGVKK